MNRNKSHETREPGFLPERNTYLDEEKEEGRKRWEGKKTSATLSQGFIFTGEQAEEVGDSGEKASRQGNAREYRRRRRKRKRSRRRRWREKNEE